MALHINKIALAAISLAVIGIAAPIRSVAQDDGGNSAQSNDITNKKIDLDLESSNLYYGLKLLFSQVKANFTIDEALKSLTVTAHLSQVPFRVALETLLKSTSTPLTYKVESGIYSVLPKIEAPLDATLEEQPTGNPPSNPNGGYKFGFIRTNNISAVDIVMAFGGHIVSVGYQPSFGQGGLGGGTGTGQNGFGGGGGQGGFGSGSQNGFGSGGNGFGNSGYGSGSTGGSQFGNGGQNGGNRGGGNTGFNGLH